MQSRISKYLIGWIPLFIIWLDTSSSFAQHFHTVSPGQTLISIARRYRVDIWDLALANHIKRNSAIRVGQTLEVPPQGVTYLRQGQTLSHIARSHKCSVQELIRINHIRNSTFLAAGRRILLPGYIPNANKKRDWGKPQQPGVALLQHRSKKMRVRLVDSQRRVFQQGIVELGMVMRRHEDDPESLPHPRLVLLLAMLSDHFGGREITVISGFREAIGFTKETSQHIEGRAVDLRVNGVPHRFVWDFCRSLKYTGCGYYPRSDFVHVDVRQRHSQWVDWSRPGKRPLYGTLTRPYRWRERRDPNRPRVTRQITRPDMLPLSVSVIDNEGETIQKVETQYVREAEEATLLNRK